MRITATWAACALGLLAISGATTMAADTTDDLLQQASTAANAGKFDSAIELATKAIKADPMSTDALELRAQLYTFRREFPKAIADYDRILELDPEAVSALYGRGRANFCAGYIEESVDDFDRFAELRPAEKPRLWERGIALYYARKFEQGAAQFALYQTYHNNDVENATWRYICMAPTTGVAKARAELLPIENDRRVPMMQIYALYRGELKPDDVLKAVAQGEPTKEQLNERQFYAELYLGLYYEAAGDAKLAQEHLTKAVAHKIGHYMWDVANVHVKRLPEEKKDPEK